MSAEEAKHSSDGPIARGDKQRDPLSIGIFLAGRLVDPFVQYAILGRGYGSSIITTLGGTVLPPGPALVAGSTIAGNVGLSPYRSILVGMAAGGMIKQNLNMIFFTTDRFEPGFAAAVGITNLVFDSLNSLLFSCAQTSASANGQIFPQTPLIIGSTLFAAGISIELISELQRYLFKQDSANKGKIYKHGLFGLSRHVNYFGFLLWRTGYAMASGGYIWGALNAAFNTAVFLRMSIPEIQTYLHERYGAQFEKYKQEVPYQLIPYIY